VAKEYVEQRNGGYYVHGTRVSFDSVFYSFLRGETAESIADCFRHWPWNRFTGLWPYLAHRAEVDEYLSRGKAEFAKLRGASTRSCTPNSTQHLD